MEKTPKVCVLLDVILTIPLKVFKLANRTCYGDETYINRLLSLRCRGSRGSWLQTLCNQSINHSHTCVYYLLYTVRAFKYVNESQVNAHTQTRCKLNLSHKKVLNPIVQSCTRCHRKYVWVRSIC